MRRGLGIGQGKGYRNLAGKDPYIHSQAAKGIRQQQLITQNILYAVNKSMNNPQDLISDKSNSLIPSEKVTIYQNILQDFINNPEKTFIGGGCQADVFKSGNYIIKVFKYRDEAVIENTINNTIANKFAYYPQSALFTRKSRIYDDKHYLVTEYVGKTMSQLHLYVYTLSSKQQKNLKEVADYLINRGYNLVDSTSSYNVAIDKEGNAVIIDFGAVYK